jgi:hypothetical protein
VLEGKEMAINIERCELMKKFRRLIVIILPDKWTPSVIHLMTNLSKLLEANCSAKKAFPIITGVKTCPQIYAKI